MVDAKQDQWVKISVFSIRDSEKDLQGYGLTGLQGSNKRSNICPTIYYLISSNFWLNRLLPETAKYLLPKFVLLRVNDSVLEDPVIK